MMPVLDGRGTPQPEPMRPVEIRPRSEGTAAALLLAVLLAAALAAPALAPYPPDHLDLDRRREAPSAAHWFGTDELGRDVLARVLYGARVSLAVGLLSAAVAGASGVAVGGVAGYAGGAIDTLLMRGTDAMLAVPRLPLLMIATSVLQPSVPLLVLLIGLAGWMETARVVRAEFATLRGRGFVENARAAASCSSRRSASSASACSRRARAGGTCSTRRRRRSPPSRGWRSRRGCSS